MIELQAKSWKKVLLANAQRIEDEMKDFFKKIYVLANYFSRNARRKMLPFFKHKTRYRTEYLFKEGTPCTHLYIIKRGEFKITKKIIVQDKEEC